MEDLIFFGGTVKAIGDGKLEGHGVMFTTPRDPDLEGDFFSKETDLGVMEGGTVPIYYQHGFDSKLKNRRIGRALAKYDDAGLWLEAQLDMRDEYEKMIYEMAQQGKLGWSSQAAGSLVEREPVGKSWHIKSWPIAEISLTPTPCEPRTSAVPVKSYMEDTVEQAPDAAQAAEQTADEIKTQNQSGETEMEKDEIVQIVKDTIGESVKSAVETSVKAAIEALPPANAGGLYDKKSVSVTKNPRESASFGKALIAWANGDNPAGFSAKAEMTLYPDSMKGAWEGGTDNEGGYAVPDDFYNGIVEQRDLLSWVRQAPVQRFVTNRDRILIPTESTAATKMVVTDEEAAYNENEPVFGQTALTIYKVTKMLKISEELMDGDAVGLEKYLQSTLARAQAKAENYYCSVGTGSSMPQGFAYASTSSSVMMATSDTIVSTDVTGAIGTLGGGYWEPGAMGFLMNPSTYLYMRGITGNPFQFADSPQGTGDINAGPTIFGYPVFMSSDCDALTVHSGKVITFGNMGFYAFAERQGLTVARNPYLYQANGIVGIFAKARFGGAFTQTTAAVHMLGHND